MSFILDVERVGITSFHDTRELVKLANRLGVSVRTKFGDREVIANPGDDPHKLYKKIEADVVSSGI